MKKRPGTHERRQLCRILNSAWFHKERRGHRPWSPDHMQFSSILSSVWFHKVGMKADLELMNQCSSVVFWVQPMPVHSVIARPRFGTDFELQNKSNVSVLWSLTLPSLSAWVLLILGQSRLKFLQSLPVILIIYVDQTTDKQSSACCFRSQIESKRAF